MWLCLVQLLITILLYDRIGCWKVYGQTLNLTKWQNIEIFFFFFNIQLSLTENISALVEILLCCSPCTRPKCYSKYRSRGLRIRGSIPSKVAISPRRKGPLELEKKEKKRRKIHMQFLLLFYAWICFQSFFL